MWHKSRIDLDNVSGKISNFLLTSPLQVVLEPGDLLFIPGYTWYYVESLTPSISLFTWSHDNQLRAYMRIWRLCTTTSTNLTCCHVNKVYSYKELFKRYVTLPRGGG